MPTQPRWNLRDTVALSNDWQAKAKPLQNKLAPRGLDAAFFTTLSTTTVQLEDAAAGRSVALGSQKASTEELKKLIKTSGDLVSLIRASLKRLFPKERGLHAATGIGSTRPLKSLPNLIAATDQLIEGLSSYSSFANAANILPADVTRLKDLRDQLRAADAAQEAQKGNTKGASASVRSLHHDVIGMLDKLLAAVMLTHADDKAAIAAFQASIPTRNRKKKVTTPGS